MPTVAQLRSQLKKLGLDTSGRKAELEARLASASAPEGRAETKRKAITNPK
eukprot:COSAG05_NODE_21512_length_271_cov_0.604651_1_plen_50_part_10